MTATRFPVAIAMATMLSGMAWGGHAATTTEGPYLGRVYSFHTPAVGACPSLDWHVVVGKNDSLDGMIGTDDMSKMFHVTGAIGPNHTFHLEGKEVGGTGRTAKVDGQVQSDGYLVANIQSIIGQSPCDHKTVMVHFYRSDDTLKGGGG